MKQLNVQDAGFIYQESEKTPMHIGGLGIYDKSSNRRKRMKKQEIFDYVEARIHLSPILKQKMMGTPGEWARPYWVDDDEFDIAQHVHHVGLPYPGEMSQLFDLVSEIMAQPLKLDIPLWQVYVIEGLNSVKGLGKNSFAILTKVHHSCFDGVAASSVLAVLNDFAPDAEPPPVPLVEENKAHRKQSTLETLSRDYLKNMFKTYEQTKSLSQRAPNLAKTAFNLYRGRMDSGAKFNVPATRFNQSPTKNRSIAYVPFKLADFKAVKSAHKGITINDIAICTISGALRRYLEHHNESTETSLGAAIPKNLRDPNDQSELRGNNVGGLFTSIHNNIADPKERLYAVHDSMTKAKQFSEKADTALLFPAMMGGFLSPRAGKAFAELSQRYDFMGNMKPAILNTLITNVPGPNFPIYHAGTKMVSFSGMLPLTAGVCLGHAVFSYLDGITVSVITCPEVMGDIEFYLECCKASFDELLEISQATT